MGHQKGTGIIECRGETCYLGFHSSLIFFFFRDVEEAPVGGFWGVLLVGPPRMNYFGKQNLSPSSQISISTKITVSKDYLQCEEINKKGSKYVEAILTYKRWLMSIWKVLKCTWAGMQGKSYTVDGNKISLFLEGKLSVTVKIDTCFDWEVPLLGIFSFGVMPRYMHKDTLYSINYNSKNGEIT
jgi:hypothetical protein